MGINGDHVHDLLTILLLEVSSCDLNQLGQLFHLELVVLLQMELTAVCDCDVAICRAAAQDIVGFARNLCTSDDIQWEDSLALADDVQANNQHRRNGMHQDVKVLPSWH